MATLDVNIESGEEGRMLELLVKREKIGEWLMTVAKYLFLALFLSLTAQVSLGTVSSDNSVVYGVPLQYFILAVFATGGGICVARIIRKSSTPQTKKITEVFVGILASYTVYLHMGNLFGSRF